MKGSPTKVIVAALLVVALTLGPAACGNGDGRVDASKSKSPPYEASYDDAVALLEREPTENASLAAKPAIARTLHHIQLSLAIGDGAAVCDDLTPTGSYELARLRGGGAGACADVVMEIGARRRSKRQRTKVSKVLSVDVYGDRASALLRSGGPAETHRVPFARDASGAWRLTSLVVLDAEAIDNPPDGATPPFDDLPRETPQEDLYDVQADFARDRGESVCDDLTSAGRREVQTYGRPGETCPDAAREIKERLMAGGYQLRSSRILSVSIKGDRATLLVKDPGHPAYRVPVVKGPGDWKLPSLRHAEPIELVRP